MASAGVGRVDGVVTDNRNVPLPGVTVTISGPALAGKRRAVTDGYGHYRFQGLPVVDSYEVHFEFTDVLTMSEGRDRIMVGFQTVIHTDLSITSGRGNRAPPNASTA